MLTTVGWCAGRPQDYPEGTTEYDLALEQASFYRDTTAVRDFRGASRPTAIWWSTQTLEAMGDHFDAVAASGALQPRIDVVLSWDPMAGAPLTELLAARPAWVNRIFLLGMHEPEVKISPAQLVEGFRYIRAQIGPRNAGVLLGPAFILYRARLGAPAELPRYLDPLVDQGLIDFVAWDGYPSDPSSSSPSKPNHYESAQSFSALPRRVSTDTGLPYAWAELHHGRIPKDTDGRGSARWHADIYRQARADGALFVTQFHYSGGDFLRRKIGGTNPVAVAPRLPEADMWSAVCQEAWACRQAALWGEDEGVGQWNQGYGQALADVETAVNNLRDGIDESELRDPLGLDGDS